MKATTKIAIQKNLNENIFKECKKILRDYDTIIKSVNLVPLKRYKGLYEGEVLYGKGEDNNVFFTF